MSRMDDGSASLARDVGQLREARRLTQAQLAATAGIPRPTHPYLESGSANPTLAVLTRVAGALQVSLEEVVGPPRATGRFYAAADLPSRRRQEVTIRKLLPEGHPGFDVERLEIPEGTRLTGVPHAPGTRGDLPCEAGARERVASGERWPPGIGDVVVFGATRRGATATRERGPRWRAA